ncbi:hypothetical protein COT51_00805 [candidate division WWE3 bacterium CG08_land_8_20_14_0_20_41_15]|uniref:DUF11 domain-containing protein n=1 Tax=candidate division WWE3 bacterium CG08_land_8_20_14_0_20_41_15 TaxID=1975086 RepID=A0A2H0XCB3_UNCKA|nr:MAG: hypothetical protein COT51_00805 [candidate division WWE3 bacterium CG08_land_8_20_14_0_20_41_15]
MPMTKNKIKFASYVALVGVIIAPLFSFLNLGGKVSASANSYDSSVTADKATVNQGENVTYTITAKNTGSSDLHDFFFANYLPDNVTYVAGSSVVSKGAVTKTVTDAWVGNGADGLNVGTLTPDQEVSVTFSVSVKNDAPGGYILSDRAFFKCNELSDWTEKGVNVTVVANPLMQYGIQVDKTTANRGDTLHYTAQIKNTGDVMLNDVLVYVYLPNYATYKNGSTSLVKDDITYPVNDDWRNSDLNAGQLLVGATATIYFDMTVNSDAPKGGEIKMTMFFKSNELPNEDYCLARTTVNVPSETSLSIDKKVKKENGDWLDSIDKGAHGHVFTAGEKVFYQIIVTNNGDEGVDNVKIVDTLPEYIQVNDNVTVVTMVGRLEPKQSKTYEFEAIVKDAPSGERKQENVAKVMTGDDEKGRDLASVWIAGGSKGSVLGEPTKLPEAGADVGIISVVTSFGLSIAGLILRKKSNSLI